MGCENSCTSQKALTGGSPSNEDSERRAQRKEKKKRKKARQELSTQGDHSSVAASGSARRKRGKSRDRAPRSVRGDNGGNEGAVATSSSSDQSDGNARAARAESRAVVASAAEQSGSPQVALPMNTEAPLPVATAAPKPKFSSSSTSDPVGGRAGPTSLPPNPLLPRTPSTIGSDHSLLSDRRRGAGSPRAAGSRSGVSNASSRAAGVNLPAAKRHRIQRWIDSGYYAELVDPQNVAEQRRLEERFQQERRTAGSSTSSSPSNASAQLTAPTSIVAVKASLKPDPSTSSSCRAVVPADPDEVAVALMLGGIPSEKEHSSNSTIAPNSPNSAQLSGPQLSEPRAA